MKKDKEEKVNLEEKVEELEKSNKWMKGILLSLVLVFFMVICIYAGVVIGKSMNDGNKEKNDKNDVKVEEENKEEEIELEQLTKDSKVVKELFEVFREDKNCLRAFWGSDFQKYIKKYIAYYALDETAFKDVKCGDLDDSYDDGLYCAMNDASVKYYSEENEKGFENAIKDETTKGVEAATLQLKYKELFGINEEIEHADFSIGYGPIAHYDKVNNLYAEFHCQCGGECVPATHTLEKIEQDATKLILYTKYVSADEEEKDESITYTFEYEKETGNYIFVSREAK